MFRVALIGLTLVVACSQVVVAEDGLESKVKQLEARIAELENALKPFMEQQRVTAAQSRARARMRMDHKIYSPAEIREIEQLYQVANRKWQSEEGKESLKKLIAKFDKANRTGCAMLYLGQMSEGDEQIQYLTKAIQDYSDCYYGDGVQVGAFARFVLAEQYKAANQADKADKIVGELKQQYGDAVDHRGRPLLATIAN
jgi:outer membrane murein-binding lipoprotein Lpp